MTHLGMSCSLVHGLRHGAPLMTTACHILSFVLTMTMTVLFVNPLPNGLQPRSDLLLVAAGDTDGHVSFWNANRDASKPSDGVHLHRPVCTGAIASNTAPAGLPR